MRELLNQDRALSPALVRSAMTILSLLFAALALLVIGQGFGTMMGGAPFAGLTQIIGGLAILFSLYLVMRLLAEILMALHRLNDRLAVLGDDMRDKSNQATPKTSEPVRNKAAARKKSPPVKSAGKG